MPLIDVLEGLNNPERYISDRIRQGSSEDEAIIARELYGSGYLGKQVQGVQEGRGLFGSLLQSAGLLDPPPPRQMSPYEEFIYTTGKEGREDRDFGKNVKQFEYGDAQRRSKEGAVATMLDIANAAGSVPPWMVENAPESREVLNNMLAERAMRMEAERQAMQLDMEYKQALIDRANTTNPPRDPDPSVVAARYLRMTEQYLQGETQRPLVQEYNFLLKTARRASNVATRVASVHRAQSILNQLMAAGRMQGIPPESIQAYLGGISTEPVMDLYNTEPAEDRLVTNADEIRNSPEHQSIFGPKPTPQYVPRPEYVRPTGFRDPNTMTE